MSASQAAFLVLFFVGVVSACYWAGKGIYRVWRYLRRPKNWRDL